MAEVRGGRNLYLKKAKKEKVKRVVIKTTRAKYVKEAEQAPLPNIRFKDRAPLLVTVVGNDDLVQQLSGSSVSDAMCRIRSRGVSLRTATDLKSYIDLSKVSDLVVFTDLEMETFEFLSLMNAHGFTKMCFFSRLDPASIKRRMWKEVSVKARVFSRIEQLEKYIATLRVRPLEMKTTSPFLFVEEMEGDKLCGYVRGGPFEEKKVHVAGLGDYRVADMATGEGPLGEKHGSRFRAKKFVAAQAGKSLGSSAKVDTDHESSDGCLSEDDEEAKGLTREDLERKYERKKKGKIDNLTRLRMEYEKAAENCTSEFLPGTYVRVTLDCDADVLRREFLSRGYLLVGTRESSGRKVVQGKVKAHKWIKGWIKSYEPVIVSMGWCRFQTVPVLSTNDGKRSRYLKRNLEDHSDITFFGPMRIGRFCLLRESGFRVLGMGGIEGDGGKIHKKCKLIGKPFKVFKNSAFIKDMFNTKDEVKRFVDAKLGCVSGLRGLIKKPVGENGNFRASFEGSISERDIVFLKCYFPVEIAKKYIEYNNESLCDIMQAEGGGMPEEVTHTYAHPKPAKVKKARKFKIPSWLEAKLPLDKRNVIEHKISIPTAPEDEEFSEMVGEIAKFRSEKNTELERVRADDALYKQKVARHKEIGRQENIKKSVIEKKKMHKKKRTPKAR